MGRTGLLVAGMFALCVVAQPRVAEVGVDGGTKETSVGTFYAPRAWGQAAVDTDMLRFEVPVSPAQSRRPIVTLSEAQQRVSGAASARILARRSSSL